MSDVIHRLDRLRNEDLDEALRETSRALQDPAQPWTVRCELFGVLGSILKAQGEVREAFKSVALGLEIATRLHAKEAMGDLYQRLASLEWEVGNHGLALAISDRAIKWHAAGGNLLGVARTLIDEGAYRYGLGQFEQCFTLYGDGLALLPEGEGRDRFVALLGLSLAAWKLGDAAGALSYGEQARAYASSAGALLGTMERHLATVLTESGQALEAEAALERAFELLTSPLDATLAGIDLIRLQLARNPQAAAHSAIHFARLLIPLRRLSEVTGPMIELIRLGQTQTSIPSRLLDQIERRAQASLARQDRSASILTSHP